MNVYGVTYPPELLTREEVARILSTSVRGVDALAAQRKLTRVDDGGKRIKFRLAEVRAHVASLPPASDADPRTYPPELLTREDVAFMLSTSTRHVADLIRTRALPSLDASASGGMATRVRLEDLRTYIERLAERSPRR